MIHLGVKPTRLTPLGWTLMATLVGLLVRIFTMAPGAISVVLVVLLVLLALTISIVDEMTDAIHRPKSRRERGGGG